MDAVDISLIFIVIACYIPWFIWNEQKFRREQRNAECAVSADEKESVSSISVR